MSSNFYFHKWRTVITQLNAVIQTDQEYQVSKTKDKRRCQAVDRLTGMLVAYISVFNDVLECSQQNLQVQKASDINAVLQAVVDRILELKNQLRKVEGCQTQFLSKGTIQQHLTVDDAEFQDIPFKVIRDEDFKAIIKNAIETAKEKIRQRELEQAKGEETPDEDSAVAWWDDDANQNEDDDDTGDIFARYDKVEELTDEALKAREMVALIQAHEKTRQVYQTNLQRKQKREMWEKELLGTRVPQATQEVSERAAQLIQKVIRIHMESKRKRIRECKTNELLGIKRCGEFYYSERDKAEQLKKRRAAIFKQFDSDWKIQCEKIKEDFSKRKRDELREHYRDGVRDWFQDWYNKIGLFLDIPHISKGGTVAIWREQVPRPEEWHERYKRYIADKQKNKPSQQAKLDKQAKLMEQKRQKLEERAKLKLEEQLKRKMMKNPNMHPGYEYPESKKLQKIFEVLENYHATWDDLDAEESIEVKEKNVKRLDVENLYAEVKLEIATEVDEDMKNELKQLKKALKKDCENAEQEMPAPMPEKKRRVKKKKIGKAPASDIVAEKMEYLAENDILKEYPRIKLEDFFGDHNFTGDDCRCLDKEANPYAGEIRSVWWERCREVTLGSHKVLVLGPAASGKTTLVRAMASLNGITCCTLRAGSPEPGRRHGDPGILAADRQCVGCMRARISARRHLHQECAPALFKKKKDANAALPNAELIKQYFIGKLFKRIHKTDNITVVGSCSDPWLTKSSKLLNKFPEVLLVPDTSYSVVVQLFNNWVVSNHRIPRDLDVHSLARALRGYSFAFIKATLEHFLTPEPIVKMAAYGLKANEIFEYVMQTGVEKADYEQYLKWYSNNTFWGKKERKQLKEALEFRAAEEKYAESMEKKKKKAIKTPGSSEADLEKNTTE